LLHTKSLLNNTVNKLQEINIVAFAIILLEGIHKYKGQQLQDPMTSRSTFLNVVSREKEGVSYGVKRWIALFVAVLCSFRYFVLLQHKSFPRSVLEFLNNLWGLGTQY
jgi:hypothetical protein